MSFCAFYVCLCLHSRVEVHVILVCVPTTNHKWGWLYGRFEFNGWFITCVWWVCQMIACLMNSSKLYIVISCFHVGTTGSLEEVDQKRVVFSLIEKHHQVLIQGQALPLQLISSFVNAYPEFSLFFQQSRWESIWFNMKLCRRTKKGFE